jgi:predicted site-specific integrase-resolvase
MPRSRDELRTAVTAGEWLRAGEVAIALAVSRTTVHRLFLDGTIGWKLKVGGKQRLADPADVRRLLAEGEQVRRGRMIVE